MSKYTNIINYHRHIKTFNKKKFFSSKIIKHPSKSLKIAIQNFLYILM